jgi:hypothetical protein
VDKKKWAWVIIYQKDKKELYKSNYFCIKRKNEMFKPNTKNMFIRINLIKTTYVMKPDTVLDFTMGIWQWRCKNK